MGDNYHGNKQVDAEQRNIQTKSVKPGRAESSGWAACRFAADTKQKRYFAADCTGRATLQPCLVHRASHVRRCRVRQELRAARRAAIALRLLSRTCHSVRGLLWGLVSP